MNVDDNMLNTYRGKDISFTKNQDYWVFGLFSSPGILGTRKHDFSETGIE
jgi:hypothetical protein